MSIEVMKQALEALETEVSIDWTNNDEFNASAEKMHEAIKSLRQAIATEESSATQEQIINSYPEKDNSKREWVGLDSEEIRTTKHHMVEGAYHYSFKQGAEWAEAKLKEMNT